MEQGFTLRDILGIVRRRWLIVTAVFALGAPLAAAIAFALPPVYASTARILVESQQIPDDLAQSTVASSAAERIQLISARLLTRDNMLRIAAEQNVFPGRRDMSPTDIVQEMRQAITLRDTGEQTRRRRDTTVTGVDIVMRHRNPRTAARVANELVGQLIAENIEDRTARAAGAVAFFNDEIRRLSQELEARETAITRFKSENQDALPETLATRQAELNLLRDRVFARVTQRALLEERRRALQQSIDTGVSLAGATGPTREEQELDRLRDALVETRAVLADSHPRVRQLAARVSALEASLAAAPDTDQTDPMTMARLAETRAQIEAIDRQMALLDEQDQTEQARLEALEAALPRTPAVEMQINALERGYAALQQQYQDALLKRAQAEIGERLEATQQSERFEVIEQAVVPDEPVSPNRPLIVAGGAAFSLAVGGGVGLLFELLNRSMRSGRDLARALQMTPIVSIPYVRSRREIALRRWRWRALLALAVAGPLAALAAIDQFFLPLPVVAQRIINATGLDRYLNNLSFLLG